MDSPLVSIIMPVYNGAEFLNAAIDSILHQTYNNIEFIIINDGSKDNSAQIIDSYKDERICYINNYSNKGIVETLNEGLDLANGKYIARMDADDISDSKRIEKQVSILESNEAIGIVATQTKGTKPSIYKFKELNSDEIKSRLLFDNIFPHPTVMFRNSTFKEFNIRYDKRFLHAEDYGLWINNIENMQYALIHEPLLIYREHSNQVSKTKREIQIQSVCDIQKIIFCKLGIDASQKEVEIHKRLFYIDYIYEMNFLLHVEEWLIKLKYANRNKKTFSSNSFENILSWVWFEVCTDFASKKIQTKKIFSKSELYNPKVYSLYYLIKYKLKEIRN